MAPALRTGVGSQRKEIYAHEHALQSVEIKMVYNC